VTSEVITARPGRDPDPGPFPGVPDWLRIQTLQWLINVLKPGARDEATDTINRIMARLRIPPEPWPKLPAPFGPQSSIGSTRTESGSRRHSRRDSGARL
jgi:hypothetical protein